MKLTLWLLIFCCDSLLSSTSADGQSNQTVFAYHVLPSEFRTKTTSLGPARGKATSKEDDHATDQPQSILPHTKDAHLDELEHQESVSSQEESSNSDEKSNQDQALQHPSSHFLLNINNLSIASDPLTASSTNEIYELAPEISNDIHSDTLNSSKHLQHIEMSSSQHFHQLLNNSYLNKTAVPAVNRTQNQLLIISFDAFRYDYNRMFRRQMPNFERIAREGVWAPMGIQTAYVTKTFPTHFSIATGLYEESHGIIDNTFFDSILNETFTIRRLKSQFFHGEPIWITAVKNNLRSRVYFWPGSEVPINGLLPTESHKYNVSIPLATRFETALRWLDNGTELAMVYFHEPDASGHEFGVGAVQMAQAIAMIDHQVGLLMEQIRLRPHVNVVFLADHGMTNLKPERLVVLEKYLDMRNDVIRIPQYGNLVGILPKPDRTKVILQKLSNVPGIKCYEKDAFPESFHYKHNDRVMPIVCTPELGGYIVRTTRDARDKLGSHGYDNRNPQMRPMFYAAGSEFRQNFKTSPFETINLYSLFCHILGVQPSTNNGTLDAVKHLLSEESLARINSSKSSINFVK